MYNSSLIYTLRSIFFVILPFYRTLDQITPLSDILYGAKYVLKSLHSRFLYFEHNNCTLKIVQKSDKEKLWLICNAIFRHSCHRSLHHSEGLVYSRIHWCIREYTKLLVYSRLHWCKYELIGK